MKRITALILCILVLALAGTSALADLKRGSQGDSVQYIQEMLIEMGFLNDVADGKFGKKTEAAVKAFQKYIGEKQTGRLTDDQQGRVYEVYSYATGMGAEDGLGEDELMEIYPSHCSWNGENAWGAEFCYRHLEPMFISKQMSYKNPPAQLEEMLENRLIEQWTLAIESMYDDWEAEVSEDGEAALALERMAWKAWKTVRTRPPGLSRRGSACARKCTGRMRRKKAKAKHREDDASCGHYLLRPGESPRVLPRKAGASHPS